MLTFAVLGEDGFAGKVVTGFTIKDVQFDNGAFGRDTGPRHHHLEVILRVNEPPGFQTFYHILLNRSSLCVGFFGVPAHKKNFWKPICLDKPARKQLRIHHNLRSGIKQKAEKYTIYVLLYR